MTMKLVVIQKIIRAGERRPDSDDAPAIADVWKVARTIGGDSLEYSPDEFLSRLMSCFKIRLKEYDKDVMSFWNKDKVKRVDRNYKPDEVLEAFKLAWNDVTRAIKKETIKVM